MENDMGLPKRNRCHPATCDHLIYSDDETEFLMAVDKFKREKNIKFPTLVELFNILKDLGYIRLRILK